MFWMLGLQLREYWEHILLQSSTFEHIDLLSYNLQASLHLDWMREHQLISQGDFENFATCLLSSFHRWSHIRPHFPQQVSASLDGNWPLHKLSPYIGVYLLMLVLVFPQKTTNHTIFFVVVFVCRFEYISLYKHINFFFLKKLSDLEYKHHKLVRNEDQHLEKWRAKNNKVRD